MPGGFSASLQCLDDTGTLVLDVDAPGYEIVAVDMPGRQWRRVVVTSDDVEGDAETQSVLASATLQLAVRVLGSTWAQVITRRDNLRNAVEQRAWQCAVTIEGSTDTWVARRADTDWSPAREEIANLRGVLTIRVPVQPRTLEES